MQYFQKQNLSQTPKFSFTETLKHRLLSLLLSRQSINESFSSKSEKST